MHTIGYKFIVFLLTLATCEDGIHNQDEEDVDCGGRWCNSCCFDGKKNLRETDIDCGGDCVDCCKDGKQNGGETSIDCGGPDCGACVGNYVDLIVNLTSMIFNVLRLKIFEYVGLIF